VSPAQNRSTSYRVSGRWYCGRGAPPSRQPHRPGQLQSLSESVSRLNQSTVDHVAGIRVCTGAASLSHARTSQDTRQAAMELSILQTCENA
jgi:hypothetical protein